MSKEVQSIPNLLFKSFEKVEYAESFIAGNVRFSTLKYFREIEDVRRRDKTEGVGQAQVDGEMLIVDLDMKTISSQPGVESLIVATNLSEHFICCFSVCEPDHFNDLPRKFGRYCVRVNSPAALFQDLAKAMTADRGLSKNPPVLEADQVRYNKDAHFLARPNRDDELRLAWSQKPACFSDELEFRYHFQFGFVSLIDSPTIYEVSVGRKLDYCQIFEHDK